MIRMIALDLDGTTLLNDHVHISERTRRTLKKAIDRGMLVVPVTGRIRTFLPEDILRMPGINYAVTSYGAVICDLKRQDVLFSACLPRGDAEWAWKLIQQENCYAEIWSQGRIYVKDEQFRRLEQMAIVPFHLGVLRKIGAPFENNGDFWASQGKTVEKINLPLLTPDRKSRLQNELSQCPGLFFVDTPDGFEVVSSCATKADGLRNFCACLKRKGVSIGMENILAIGDSGGDAEMLRKAGIGVAMGNACDSLKKLADAVTLANDRDGAAAAIERYAFSD